MTTTTYCPRWCGIDHDRIESEGAHTAEVATWVGNGSVDCVRQPCGDYEVQLWHAGDVALELSAQGSAAVLRDMARGLLEAAQRVEALERQR